LFWSFDWAWAAIGVTAVAASSKPTILVDMVRIGKLSIISRRDASFHAVIGFVD
jgi:hypothetical protein